MKHTANKKKESLFEDGFLTAYEVQELLGMDLNTIYTLLKNKKIPGIKIGAQWRIPCEEFYDF